MAKIAELKNRAQKLRAAGLKELVPILETWSACLIASMVAQSALAREESRGDHYRKDFPQRDDPHWLKHIVFQPSRTEKRRMKLIERRWVKIEKGGF
jgi:succinate dehydrogenase/fumarate reductase flavoprotein subunit